eukprot:907812-Prorocentrum_lima.AAC.1
MHQLQSSVDLITRAMREIMPTSDLSRMRMAQELQTTASKVPGTLAQLAIWLEDYIHKLGHGM